MKSDKYSVRCSTVLASYNGERFIDEQIRSILVNMKKNDELIITDDGSTDGTLDIISGYARFDERIRLVKGPGKGVIKNVENGLRFTRGQYIFLSDQDDIWLENKIDTVLDMIGVKKHCLILHDAYILSDGQVLPYSFSQFRKSKKGFWRNLLKNSYIGCCICFTRDLLDYILPFPEEICMHDQWIGLVTERRGTTIFIKNKLIYYRRHSDNVSSMESPFSFSEKMRNRRNMLFAVLKHVL